MTRSMASARGGGSKSGHVFVVHGRIGELSCDAVVVPTDAIFNVEGHWSEALGFDVPADRPDGWGSGSVAVSPTRPDVYYVDVAPATAEDARWLGFQATNVLMMIAESGIRPSAGRVVPLVALPVLGTGEGGFRERIGEAIVQVLAGAGNAAASGVDVVLVTPHLSTYAAIQHQRRRAVQGTSVDDEVKRLAALARTGQLAIFLGAGVSVPSGLPSWKELLSDLTSRVGLSEEVLNELGDVDKAEYVQRVLTSQHDGRTIGDLVGDAMSGTAKPALAHALLASLHVNHAVTTNYDDLFERASSAAGTQTQVVLPWSYPSSPAPWLLKLHGDLERGSIVLTRSSFVSFDSAARPAGAVFQSLLLTEHVLFVGVSMTDDNVLRLIHEVSEYADSYSEGRVTGTVIDVSERPARRALWEGRLAWITMSGPDTDDIVARAREMEIFLDAVAMHASRDTAWIFDAAFEFLLDGMTRKSVRELRSVIQSSRSNDPAWRAVVESLEHFGLATETAPTPPGPPPTAPDEGTARSRSRPRRWLRS